MKALLKKSLFVALAAAAPSLLAEPPKAPAPKLPPPHSVFVMPVNTSEGRDPFFPESNRVFEDNPATQHHTIDENSFKIKGISYEHGRPMVIVNNHTFAVGDEGDVLTTAGRVHLRLIEIRADYVTIEVNGSRRQLSTGNK